MAKKRRKAMPSGTIAAKKLRQLLIESETTKGPYSTKTDNMSLSITTLNGILEIYELRAVQDHRTSRIYLESSKDPDCRCAYCGRYRKKSVPDCPGCAAPW